MRTLIIQLKDANGNVTEEKEINACENELLIMKYPKTMTKHQSLQCYENLSKALETGKGLIGLPESINFEVIKIN